MKLCTTTQSERGKTIQKTGNEYINICVTDEQGVKLSDITVFMTGESPHINIYECQKNMVSLFKR